MTRLPFSNVRDFTMVRSQLQVETGARGATYRVQGSVPTAGHLSREGKETVAKRPIAAFSFLVTPDLIRGPRLQRRSGSRIKSGMTKV
jgi:hypothetical protein